MKRVAPIALATIVSAAAAAVSVAWLSAPAPRPACHGPVAHPAVDLVTPPAADAVVGAADLRGLWSRHPDGNGREDSPVAFYYFHDGGIGLYRYGRIGHNTTNSYRWAVADHGGQTFLVLSYTKTGEVQHLQVRLEQDGRRTLVIDADPKNPGTSKSRYVFVPPPSLSALAPDLQLTPLSPPATVSDGAPGLDNRLWIDERRFKTGGMGFSLYQLRAAGIDGRGTGWHHVGDYDDWSTESLSYRLLRGDSGVDRVDLTFTLRGERHLSPLRVDVDAAGKRSLTLLSDPRDYLAAHTYKDGGPSFAALVTHHAITHLQGAAAH